MCFVDSRPPLLPEANPRATTAVEGPQNTLRSRGLGLRRGIKYFPTLFGGGGGAKFYSGILEYLPPPSTHTL